MHKGVTFSLSTTVHICMIRYMIKKHKKHSFLHVFFISINDNIVFVTSLVHQKQPVALGKKGDIVYVEMAMSRGSSSGHVLFAKI